MPVPLMPIRPTFSPSLMENAVSSNSRLSVYDFVKCSIVTRFIYLSSLCLFTGSFAQNIPYSITSSTGQWSEPMTSVWMEALTSLSFRLSDTQK